MSSDTSIQQDLKGHSLWSDAWIRLRKNHMAMVSLVILFFIAVCCFVVLTYYSTFLDMSSDIRTNFL